MKLYLDELDSPIGMLRVVNDGKVLRAIEFEDYETRLHRYLQRHCAAQYTVHAAESVGVAAEIRARLMAYLAGDLQAIDAIAVRTGGTPFQQRVWAALRRIPAGATMSYGQLAQTIGSPSATRAVGLANGANPIPVVVPCHRVIGASGKLTGFGGGLHRKQWLLSHESGQGVLAMSAPDALSAT